MIVLIWLPSRMLIVAAGFEQHAQLKGYGCVFCDYYSGGACRGAESLPPYHFGPDNMGTTGFDSFSSLTRVVSLVVLKS